MSGYLDFAERQAEREQAMTMKDLAKRRIKIKFVDYEKNMVFKMRKRIEFRKSATAVVQMENLIYPLFDAHLVRLILKNLVYCGKIAYGRRKTQKVHGTRNEYYLVEQDNYILVDGQNEN